MILPDLSHVAHIPLVAVMAPAELGRFLGVAVRLAVPEPSPPPPPPAAPQPLAVGLVHRPLGTPSLDRTWARAVVVRHARDARLQLVDVLELDDQPDRTRAVLSRLNHLAAASQISVLITDGLDTDLARRLAHDLRLEHQAVPPRSRTFAIE